jgi:hypothetical protein
MFANKKLPKNTNEHKYIYIVIVCYSVTMNKVFVVGVVLLMVCVVAVCVINIVEEELIITPISINQEGYSDLYKVECSNKEFYTTYPDRLNFNEVCK